MQTRSTTAPCPFAPSPGFRQAQKPARRSLLALFFPPFRQHILDVRTLPDHLKRDIGVLDGNDPRGPRP